MNAMVSFLAGVLLGPWCWAVLIALVLAIFTAFWVPLAVIAVRRQRREDREWAAGAAGRVRTAEYLHWLEDEFAAMEAERPGH